MRCSRRASILPRAVASTCRSPIRDHGAAEQRLVDDHLELDRRPGQAGERVGERGPLRVLDGCGRARARAMRQPRACAVCSTSQSRVPTNVACPAAGRRRSGPARGCSAAPCPPEADWPVPAGPRSSRSRSTRAVRRAGVGATIRAKRKRSSSSDASSACERSSSWRWRSRPPAGETASGSAASRRTPGLRQRDGHDVGHPATAVGTSGAATTEQANAASAGRGSETLPSRRSSMTARAAAPRHGGIGQSRRAAWRWRTPTARLLQFAGQPTERAGTPAAFENGGGVTLKTSGSLMRPGTGGCTTGRHRPAARARPRRSGPGGPRRYLSPDDPLDHVHDDLPHAVAASSTARWRASPTSVSALVTTRSYSLCALAWALGAHLLGRPIGLGHDLARLLPGLFEHAVRRSSVGRGGIGLGLVGRRQLVGNHRLPLLKRLLQDGQHILGDDTKDEDGTPPTRR